MHLQGLWLFARGEVDQGANRARDQKSVGVVQDGIFLFLSLNGIFIRPSIIQDNKGIYRQEL